MRYRHGADGLKSMAVHVLSAPAYPGERQAMREYGIRCVSVGVG